MRHVEVVAVAKAIPVQPAVVGEGEPGREVGRIDPRVAKDAARVGLNQKSGVTYAGDLHKYLPGAAQTPWRPRRGNGFSATELSARRHPRRPAATGRSGHADRPHRWL